MLLIAFLFHFNCLDWLKTDMRNTFSSLVDKNKNQYWFRICVCGVSSHHASGTGESMPFSYKPNRNYRFRWHSHWNMNINNIGLRRAQVAKHMNSQPIVQRRLSWIFNCTLCSKFREWKICKFSGNGNYLFAQRIPNAPKLNFYTIYSNVRFFSIKINTNIR